MMIRNLDVRKLHCIDVQAQIFALMLFQKQKIHLGYYSINLLFYHPISMVKFAFSLLKQEITHPL